MVFFKPKNYISIVRICCFCGFDFSVNWTYLGSGQGVGQNKANFTMNSGKLMDNFPYFLIFYTKSLVAALDKCHQESRIHMAMWSRVHIPHNFNILGWGNEMQNAQKRLKESQPAMIMSCSEVILFPLQPDQHHDSNEDDYLHVRT